MAFKNIFLTEEQVKYINERKSIPKWCVDPQKVLLVKRYLDKGFKRANMTGIGDDGYRILKNGDTPAQISSGRFFYSSILLKSSIPNFL